MGLATSSAAVFTPMEDNLDSSEANDHNQNSVEEAGEEEENGRGTTCTSARQVPSGGLCEAPALSLTTSSGAVLSPIEENLEGAGEPCAEEEIHKDLSE